MNLTPHQLDALSAATRNGSGIGLLTGYPGTGKTTTVASHISGLAGADVACAAPTGKAANRLTQSLSRNGLAVTATTIHRLLAYQYDAETGGGRFMHDVSNPLPWQHVFVDEASMVDVSLAASLMSAMRKGSSCLWIFDENQLSPVGHGAPARDLLTLPWIPHGHLSEIHRNAGRIVKTCKLIAEQQRFEFSERLDLDAESPENLICHRAAGPDATRDGIDLWLQRARDDFGLDPIRDVQIVTPLNEKSESSRLALLPWLQGRLNPTGEDSAVLGCKGGRMMRPRDKIVCTKNGYYSAGPDCPRDQVSDGKIYCANGEQAIVSAIGPAGRVFADLDYPRRQVAISKTRDDAEGKWESADAITVHKSQGSEWPMVIVVADERGRMVADRHWMLTAISRASKFCVVIGLPKVVEQWCKVSNLWRRKTFVNAIMRELRYGNAA